MHDIPRQLGKRQPCHGTGLWFSGVVGDCSQHLKTGECPRLSGIGITHVGGAYAFPPEIIIENGGSAATGAIVEPLLSCGTSGTVTGFLITSSGWHFTQSPVIKCRGEFVDNQPGACGGTSTCNSDTDWDDPVCMCSGSGIVFGYKIYEMLLWYLPNALTYI